MHINLSIDEMQEVVKKTDGCLVWGGSLYLAPADTTPPVSTISLSGILGDNDWFTSDVTVTLSAADDTKTDKTEYSLDNIFWTTYTTPFDITNEGITIVYYRSIDMADNMEVTETETIKIDKTGPSGSITIAGGATYTNSTSVTLTLSANDATSGVNQMRFSNDNVSWLYWKAYATSKSWTLLPEDGVKGVTVQYRDNAGLISSFSDSIILDTTKPTANAGVDQTVNVGATVTFEADGSTDNVGIMSYEWGFGDGTTAIGKITTHTYANPGSYTVTLTVRDAAGNTDAHSISVTVLEASAPISPNRTFSIMDCRRVEELSVVIVPRHRLHKCSATIVRGCILLMRGSPPSVSSFSNSWT